MRYRPRFYNGGLYHLYNRGVEKRAIFENDKDRLRFIHDLFEFNDLNIMMNSTFYHAHYFKGKVPELERRPRKLLVDILAFVLMSNHYHLLVRQRRENGVPLFMKKLGAGYTGYFNVKHERSGVLFQGGYKVRPIANDRYLRYLMSYIHANPVERLVGGESRQAGEALRRLRQYRWSSYPDVLGEKNYPSVLNLDLVRDFGLPMSLKQEAEIRDWLENRSMYKNFIQGSLFS